MIDAIRVVPIVALLLFLLPLLGAAQMARSTASSGIFLFAAWFAAILATALISRALARSPGGVGADPLEPGSNETDRPEA
nr:hypothetical protein [Maritimibacter sp. DP1N21-5]